MEVVNGKIVSARSQRSSGEGWSGLKPSRGLLVESIYGSSDHLRGNGRELWAPSWDNPSSFSHENPPSRGAPGAALCPGPGSNRLALEAGVARWSQRPLSEMHHGGARHEYTGLQPRRVAEHRQGWGDDQRHYHAGACPWSETRMDRMMAKYESDIIQTGPDHVAVTTPPGQEISKERSLERSASDAQGSKQESEPLSTPKSTLVGVSSDHKRKHSEIIICDEADQEDCRWSHPLTLLVRKGLSVSDVGDLG